MTSVFSRQLVASHRASLQRHARLSVPTLWFALHTYNAYTHRRCNLIAYSAHIEFERVYRLAIEYGGIYSFGSLINQRAFVVACVRQPHTLRLMPSDNQLTHSSLDILRDDRYLPFFFLFYLFFFFAVCLLHCLNALILRQLCLGLPNLSNDKLSESGDVVKRHLQTTFACN